MYVAEKDLCGKWDLFLKEENIGYIDFDANEVYSNAKRMKVGIAKASMCILKKLVSNSHSIVKHKTLYRSYTDDSEVYDENYAGNSVKTQISILRNVNGKLFADCIVTKRGLGYMFKADIKKNGRDTANLRKDEDLFSNECACIGDTNTQQDINKDHARKITEPEIKTKELQSSGLTLVDFNEYYEEVEKKFTAKKRGEYRNLVGEEPDETSYIDAFITKEGEDISVLSFLEEWVVKTEPGVILIHGEPGHGKTTLCNKASYEFYHKRFLADKAKNVLAVSLNTGKNRQIVKDGKVKLSNALVFQVEADDEITFSFEDCRGSLLFLDGFDEFIDEAKRTNVDNICSFMDTVDNIAAKYEIHIVVLSRTIAVSRNLKELNGSFEYYKLSPISDEQQNNWFDQHNEYDDYREAFNKLRSDEDMQKLLRVPFLFRLIVNSKFETATSNIVELYDNLFAHLMRKRGICDADREIVKEGLMNLAFEIYCTDTLMAKMDWNPQWVFAFYVESSDGDRIGFFHGTFYQYFLAKYIYSKIFKITDDNVEGFIGSFAERELDDTVRRYLELMYREEDESKIHPNIGKMIDALVRTEAYLNFSPHVESEYAERSKILRSTNIYRNTLHIVEAVSYVIQTPFKGKLDILMQTFNSERIVLLGDGDRNLDLSGANLSRAYLGEAYLVLVDLIEANLREANLSGAVLIRADLREADLVSADLSYADLRCDDLRRADLSYANLGYADLRRADLSGADLSGANLSGADLSGANLSGANLSGANLRDAIIDIKNKEVIDQSIDGYSSIIWVLDETL